MNKREFPQWFIDELYLEEDKERARSGELKSSDKPLFYCPVCKDTYIQRVASHITLSTKDKKKGCPRCGIKKQIASSHKTKGFDKPYPQWFIDELYLEEDKDKASSENTTILGKDKKQFYCNKHQILYTKRVRDLIDLKNHIKKSGCPKCSVERQKENRPDRVRFITYPQWFIDELYLESDKDKASTGELRLSDKAVFYCPLHDKTYTQFVYSHIDSNSLLKKHGCSLCGKEKYLDSLSTNREYPQWFIDELYLDSDKDKAKSGTLSSSSMVMFKCASGHTYYQHVKSHIILSRKERYKGCPICHPNRSKPELEIEEYIRSLNIHTEHRRFHSNTLGMFEIDIFIPSLNIGIEYNGSYWHKTLPKEEYSKDKMYHNKKYEACKELGIRLISIFDVDWDTKKEKIKMFFRNILQTQNDSNKIKNRLFARKCEVVQIDYTIANDLYDQYHLLGKTNVQSVSYGLYYNNDIVACMSFQLGRYKENKEPVWCLTRFVTKSDTIIIGGASKLITRFEKEFCPKIIVSYSDNDYFSGNVYSKLGFTCLGDTKSPRYYWYLNNKEYRREQCQLRHLAKKYPDLYKESLTISGNKEDYIMLKLGAHKVYRSGHTKWVKRIP